MTSTTRGADGRRRVVVRDVEVRTRPAARMAGVPLVLAGVAAGQTGLLSRPVGLVLTAAAAVLALVVAVVRSRACVEIHRDVLRYRVLWQLREVPVSEVGFPEQRRRTIDDLLVVRVAGRRPIRLSSTLWEPDAMEQLARELTLRGSAARRA